ncbi:hypothetical protein B0P06_003826 [Clostridium saccharoperbutylacetonicum]|nr:hypothetical protein [Clostridium saccharoperbutylacetonicum]
MRINDRCSARQIKEPVPIKTLEDIVLIENI